MTVPPFSSFTPSTWSSGISQTRSPFCLRSVVEGSFLSKKKTKAKRPTTRPVRMISFLGVMRSARQRRAPLVAAAVPDPDADDDRDGRHPRDREEPDPVDLGPREGQRGLFRRLRRDSDEALVAGEPVDRVQEEVGVDAVVDVAVGSAPRVADD